jgi:hypothetical protein
LKRLASVALALVASTALAEPMPPQRHVAFARAALARVPVSKRDRTPERLGRRAEMLETFAAEIARVSERAPLPPQQWMSLLVTQASIETNIDTEVVAGRCLRFQCDPHLVKGAVVHRAVGAFQQQLVSYVADLWPTAAGNVPAQVEMADRSLRRSMTRCKPFAPFPAHVFRAYGGGSCSWPVAREAERVGLYLRLVATPSQKGGAS